MIGYLRSLARRNRPLRAAYHAWSEERSRAARHTEYRHPELGFVLHADSAMYAGGFEPAEASCLRRHLRRMDVFVDVGAHVGLYSCMARALGKRVLAIEPVPSNLRLLTRNLQENGWLDVEVLPLALADDPGLRMLFGAGTGASLFQGWAGAVDGSLVPVTTLDSVLGGRFEGERLLIKIDVEGAELAVLRGAVQTLGRTPPPIWLVEITLAEHHPAGLNPNFEATFQLFWDHGYEARAIPDAGRPIDIADVRRWTEAGWRDLGTYNFLFV